MYLNEQEMEGSVALFGVLILWYLSPLVCSHHVLEQTVAVTRGQIVTVLSTRSVSCCLAPRSKRCDHFCRICSAGLLVTLVLV